MSYSEDFTTGYHFTASKVYKPASQSSMHSSSEAVFQNKSNTYCIYVHFHKHAFTKTKKNPSKKKQIGIRDKALERERDIYKHFYKALYPFCLLIP